MLIILNYGNQKDVELGLILMFDLMTLIRRLEECLLR